MELDDFGGAFAPGYSLSIEERSALEVQMAKRKSDEKLYSIKFWGRVTATTADYLVVCGTVSTLETPARKWYYATTKNLTLHEFPELTEAFAKLAGGISGRFLGNPGKLLGPDADAAPEEEELDEAGNPKPKPARFSEAHRLAHTVAAIEADTGLVPRGAYVVTPTHHIVAEPMFVGLSGTEATSLDSYLHFRPAQHPSRAHALHKAAPVPNAAFLDPASEDEPKGVWALRLDAGRGLVEVRSLKWPGYLFYHAVGTARYGGVYVGAGLLNGDLQFMM